MPPVWLETFACLPATPRMSAIPNLLAERYASKAIVNIWSAEGRIVFERKFCIVVMKAQKKKKKKKKKK
ncbi:MAG: hypothetical protein ABGY95_11800 [Rubritalea sp.]